MSASQVVIEKSQRNKEVVYLDGYVYNEGWKGVANKAARRYRCRDRKCGAKLTLSEQNEVVEVTNHKHPPNYERNVAEITLKKVKEKALESTDSPTQIVEYFAENLKEHVNKRNLRTLKDTVTKVRKRCSKGDIKADESVPLTLCAPKKVCRTTSPSKNDFEEDCSRMIDFGGNQQQNPQDMDRILRQMKRMIPPLRFDNHKGQSGRIAVIGGSEEYTGAPYFAAISALKVGADLVHVFCSKEASPVIKSYSPELIVHPILDKENNIEELETWLDRMHAVVIGPGLGRLSTTLETVANIILKIREKSIPLVIDADGLFLVTQRPDIIRGYTKAVLTPNIVEYRRLASALNVSSESILEVSKALDGPVVVKKGMIDEVSNSKLVFNVSEPGSPRRCGGQGDLLAGSLATFLFWAHSRSVLLEDTTIDTTDLNMISAYSACFLTKHCACRAYIKSGRSTTTTDLINEIHPIFSTLFEGGA